MLTAFTTVPGRLILRSVKTCGHDVGPTGVYITRMLSTLSHTCLYCLGVVIFADLDVLPWCRDLGDVDVFIDYSDQSAPSSDKERNEVLLSGGISGALYTRCVSL